MWTVHGAVYYVPYSRIKLHMAMAITIRMVARIFFATEVTQGPFSSVHYTHIKHTPKSCCTICSGFEDTTKMSPRSKCLCSVFVHINKNKTKIKIPTISISSENTQASASTITICAWRIVGGGCMFKATADCATGVWCVFYERILDT